MNPITVVRATLKSPRAEADDQDLAARLARGEPAALDELIERFGSRVSGLAARLLDWGEGADDVAQDVFLAVWKKPQAFRGESRLWTYLATMTVNRCRSLRRRAWVKQRVLGALSLAPVRSTTPHPEEQQETAAVVRAAIARLPDGYREVVVLRYLEELSIAEIASVLGVRRNTVEVRLARARSKLERKLAHLSDAIE